MQAVIIAVVITFIVTCAITWFVANAYQKKYDTIVSALQGTVNLPEGYNLGICYLAELM